MTTVIQHLRRTILSRDAATLSDGQLLDYFLTQREDAAFAALVRRHGPMVFAVCRRVLADLHDAEDAFQATFLVLVRKAATIRPRDRVGPWLHGVAYRTASKARCRAARRRAVERSACPARWVESPTDDAVWRDLRPLLDAEVQGLPEAYRAPVVLCDLEGASRGEAAHRLGVPEGTISSRLARGREMLGQRLRRRGVALSAGVVALALARNATATLPPSLLETTVHGALHGGGSVPVVALAEGVIHAMFYSQSKLVAAVLAVAGLVALGLGVGAHRAQAEKPNPTPVAATALAADKGDKPEVGPSIPATVVEVDAKKNTITLRVQAEPGKKETVNRTYMLPKDVKIHLEHGLKKETKDGTTADLSEGTPVTVQLSVDKKSVVSVNVHGATIHGGVKSVDAAKKTITVTFKGGDGLEEKTYSLHPDAQIILDDGIGKKGDKPKEGKLTDAAEGLPVLVQLSAQDRTQALRVIVSGPTLSGIVKSVDTANNTITLSVKEDGQLVEKTLPLSKDVKVDDGKVGDLAGAGASVRLSVEDHKTVVQIHVHKQ